MDLERIIKSRIGQLTEDQKDFEISEMWCLFNDNSEGRYRNRRWSEETGKIINELYDLLDIYYNGKFEKCWKCDGEGEFWDGLDYMECSVCDGSGQAPIVE
jgi:hypothetical protein